MHFLERRRTSNTAWLAAHALEHCSIVLRGIKDQPFDAEAVAQPPASGSTLLLYATETATTLDPTYVASLARPVKLVVPDGTWGQTRRMLHREPVLRALPTVRVAASPPSIYRLRRARRPHELCTLEAIARALGTLECPDVERQLMDMLKVMVHAGMATRGNPRADRESTTPSVENAR